MQKRSLLGTGVATAMFFASGLVALSALTNEACKVSETVNAQDRKVVVLENAYLKLAVMPAGGGAIKSLVHKRTGFEYAYGAEGFLLDLDYSTGQSASSDYPKQDYVFEIAENTPERVSVKLKGQSKIPPLNWIEVSKTIALERNSSAIGVLYQYANHPDSMQSISIKPWIHNVLASLGPDAVYVMPLETGRYEITTPKAGADSNKFGSNAAQGWCGAFAPGGNGLACLLPFKDVYQYYQWVSAEIGTLEWRIAAQDVPNGKSFATWSMILPFAGLSGLSGGADGVLCGLIVPKGMAQGKPVAYDAELLSAKALDGINVDARVRPLADGTWKTLGAKQCALNADTPLKLSFEPWTPDKAGTWVLQSRVSRNGKKLFDAERTVVIGAATPGYILPTEGPRDAGLNIVSDSSAESKDDRLWFHPEAVFDDAVAHSGRSSIKVEKVNDTTAPRALFSHYKAPVKPGTKYTVSFWARVQVADDFMLRVYNVDDQGKSKEEERCEVWFTNEKERSRGWKRFETVFESRPDAKFVTIHIFTYGATQLCWFDDLSMVPGESTPQATPAQTDIPYTLDVVTPHVPWARPYARGSVKALLLTHQGAARDIIELAQRLEMKFEAVTISASTDYCAWSSGSMPGRRIEDEQSNICEKLNQKYDVIIIGEIPWRWLNEKARQAIMKQVFEGTGLIYVQPNRVLDDLMKPEKAGAGWPMKFPGVNNFRWSRPEPLAPYKLKEHAITSGMPLRLLMPMQYGNWQTAGETLAAYDPQTPMLAVGQYGGGRVVALNYCTSIWMGPNDEARLESSGGGLFYGAGLFPLLQSGTQFKPDSIKYHYWEYLWALFARTTVWAAHKEPEVAVDGIEPDAGGATLAQGPRESVSVSFRSRHKIAGTLGVAFFDEYSNPMGTEQKKVKLNADGSNPFSFATPQNAPAGLIFAEFILRDAEGKSLNWAATAFDNPKPARIEAIELDRGNKVYKRSEKISAKIRLAGAISGATIQIDVVDTYNRLILTQSVNPAGNEVPLEFALENPRSVRMVIRATLLQGRRLLDRAETWFTIMPEKSPWDQYQLAINSLRTTREYLHEAMYAAYQDAGATCIMAHDALDEADHNLNSGVSVSYFGDVRSKVAPDWSKYLQTGDLKYLERNPPAYDENKWKDLQAGLERAGTDCAQISPLMYELGDENNLGGGECDYDYSKPTLDWFRKWLQERYGTLEKLNGQWETTFTKWEEVMPMPLPEAQKRSQNLAPWADHREFMDYVFAEFFARARAALRRGDPNAICGISGTQIPNAYNGYNWWKLMQVFDALQAYAGGNQEDIQRSFKRVPSMGWAGYSQTGPGVPYQFWSYLMYNKQCALWRDWLIFEPDWRISRSGNEYVQAAKPLLGGIGKLVMQSDWIPGGVAIHYSQASIRAAAGTKRARAFEQARGSWVALLQDLGLQPDFVAYEQIEQGRLDPKRHRVLILPESAAMSVKEVAAIRKYVEEGGVVIADALTAVRDEHCRLLPAGQLDEFFGIRRGPAGKERPPRSIELRDTAALKWPHKQLTLNAAEDGAGITTTSGKALGDCRGTPCFIYRSIGRGKTIYLNFNSTGYARTVEEGARFRDVMRRLFDNLGVSSPASVMGEDGKPFLGCQVNMFRNGSEDLVAVLPDLEYFQNMGWPRKTVTAKLPGMGWIYEVVTGKKIGRAAEARCELPMNELRLFAILPAEVTGVAIEGPKSAKPGEMVKFNIQVQGSSKLKDRQLVRIEVAGPDGKAQKAYSTIAWMPAEGGTHAIPLALNDPTGKWRLKVIHIVSGVTAERVFNVRLKAWWRR